jgi:RHS repeat-associated protein
MAPDLALRYSSGSPLRGGVAAGWTMEVPSISVDRSFGTESMRAFQASLGSARGHLVPVPDRLPFGGRAYRAEFDGSFTRFFRRRDGALSTWTALTTDGVRHDFGDEPGSRDHSVRWRVTRQTDPHGNTVRYLWARGMSGGYSEYHLERIEYGANAGADLGAHARVVFSYAPYDLCQGSTLPIGAAPDRGNPTVVDGARRLTAITTSVRTQKPGIWRVARRIDLDYQLGSSRLHQVASPPTQDRPPTSMACTEGLLRYLTRIRVTAFDPNNAPTTVPATTFTYNQRQRGPAPAPSDLGVPAFDTGEPAPFDTRVLPSPGPSHYGDNDNALGTLQDIDNDGVRDRVAVIEKQAVCTLVWQKGNAGGTFEARKREAPLPTAPWSTDPDPFEDLPGPRSPERRYKEGCSLDGQLTYRWRSAPGTLSGNAWDPGLVSYHFMDYTGDGRVDVLTNVWAAHSWETFAPRVAVIGGTRLSASKVAGAYRPHRGQRDARVAVAPPPPTGGPATPERVWRVYRNAHDPAAFIPGGDPTVAFERASHIKVVPPEQEGEDCAPEPLGPSSADNLVDTDVNRQPDVGVPSLTDLDGDGFLDLVDVGKSTGALRFDGEWCVWFGSGGTSFSRAYRWRVPKIQLRGRESGIDERFDDEAGRRHEQMSVAAALLDMNGDHLADLVAQTGDGHLKAYLNTGRGFDIRSTDLGVMDPVERVQTNYAYTGTTVRDGARGYRLRLVDVDGDGFLDQLAINTSDKDITDAGRVLVRFSNGERFGPQVELPARWADARRLMIYKDSGWRLTTEFDDATGDGLADLASWRLPRHVSVASSPGLPAAPDLLSAVENGRGARTSFEYGISTNPALVSRGDESVRRTSGSLPRPTWLVSTITTGGGFDTPRTRTRYTYADPRVVASNAGAGRAEPPRFAGMGLVRKTVSSADEALLRQTTRSYAYGEHGDPTGRVGAEWVHRRNGNDWQLHSYTHTDWAWKPLFSDRTFFAYPASSLTRTCRPRATDAACMAQTQAVHRSREVWRPARCRTPSTRIPLYVRTIQQDGTGVEVGPQDRRTVRASQVRCGQPPYAASDYRVLVANTTFQQARRGPSGFAFSDTRGRTRVKYNAAGLPAQTDEWRSAMESDVATTKRTFSAATGVLRSVTKPEQAAPGGSGQRTTYTYDQQALFVRRTVNELDHVLHTRYDTATGALVERKGPNAVSLPSEETALEGESWRIDGLGREVAHAVSFDDAAAGYKQETISKTTYLDTELPNRVRTEQLRDVGGDVWVTRDKTLDGFGRPLAERQYLDSDHAAVTTYTYDGDGRLRAVEVPDPRSDDDARVSYTYAHDGLGRVVSVTRPNASGQRITYSGLDRRIEEIAADGSGAKHDQIYDALDRLTAVRELSPGAEPAVTRYRYDGRDEPVRITDADGNTTNLTHDWSQQRVAVSRGARTWRYRYDRNGNLAAEITPSAPSADPATNTVHHTYDDLDRVKTDRFRDAPTPTGSGGMTTVQYQYDQGPNGTGRLRRVTLPFGLILYGYDARGLVTTEQRSFAPNGLATFGATQRVRRTYNAQGQPSQSTWDDGQQSRTDYDTRGLVDAVDWYDPTANDWRHVAAFTRSLAGQPRERSSSFGQTRRTTYDILGRVASDTVLSRPGDVAVATRSYSYNDSGDLTATTGETDGAAAAASYTYDAQHRLTGATGPNGYAGSFTYSPAGNTATANVSWNGSPENRHVRYEYGATDPQAVDRLVSIASGGAYADYRYDPSGNMTQRVTRGDTTSFQWDGEQRLRGVRNGDRSETFLYDHDGVRMLAISKTSGVRFWFGESETHYTLDGKQTLRYLHLSDPDSTLARVENKTTIELQYADALQNLMLATDATGAVVAGFAYGPFGEIVSSKDQGDHRRQFNGKETDPLTGLRYYGVRYYDPLALRWSSGDPLYRLVPDVGTTDPQRLNLYAFSANNPVRYYDADGRDGEEAAQDGAQPSDDSTAEGCVVVEGEGGAANCAPVDEGQTIDVDNSKPAEEALTDLEAEALQGEEQRARRDYAVYQLNAAQTKLASDAKQLSKAVQERNEADKKLEQTKLETFGKAGRAALSIGKNLSKLAAAAKTGAKCVTAGLGCGVAIGVDVAKIGIAIWQRHVAQQKADAAREAVALHARHVREGIRNTLGAVSVLIDIAQHRDR